MLFHLTIRQVPAQVVVEVYCNFQMIDLSEQLRAYLQTKDVLGAYKPRNRMWYDVLESLNIRL